MDSLERDQMISDLAQITPRYAYNCKEFIPGETQVYYSGPYWDHRELEMAMKALLTGKWLVSGEYVQRFQSAFADRFNVKHAHMVNSGSSANLALITAIKKHMGWVDGSRIVVSPVGFPTTIAPIVQNNLIPQFVDIEMDTLNFDINKIWEMMVENDDNIVNPIVAIFVSPVLGNPPNIGELKALCDAYGILLIGDNCDSIGSRFYGKDISDYYYAWTSSFYPAHHISTGEGGMVCSNDKELMDLVRSISWWGRDCHCVGSANLLSCGTCGNRFDKWLDGYNGVIDHKYLFTNMGYNLKPLDLQGAIGLAQLEKFDEIERLRRENFNTFSCLLEKYVKGIRIASNVAGSDPCWFGVPIICDSQELKVSLVAHLEDNKIQTRNYFAGNILLHPAYKNLDDAYDYPNANKALSNVFFVGCPPHYNDQVFDYIEEVLKKWQV